MLTLERIIEDELFIQCPLVSTAEFINLSEERGIVVNEGDLELCEKLGIFYPIVRVEFPKFKEKVEYVENGTRYRHLGVLQENEVWDGPVEEMYGHFWWDRDIAEEFRQAGLLWSPREQPFVPWSAFYDRDLMHKKIENYYSIFQIYPLYMLKQMSTMNLSLMWWSTYDNEGRNKLAAQVTEISAQLVKSLQEGSGISDQIVVACQAISNRYFPKTQTDKRTLLVAHPSTYHDWSWRDYCRKWDANLELSKMALNVESLKKYQQTMSMRARFCDPLAEWYDLVQFVSLDEKKRLKKDALLAQTFYSMEMMLRLFYEDLTGQALCNDVGAESKWKERVYGEGVPQSNMIFLEYLTNKFHLNPRPKLILIVEGKSEYEQIPRLADEVGYSFDGLGIRMELLEGIGNFTSGKIERFIDHYHNLQTIVYLVLDNEGNAIKFRDKLLKKKSRYTEASRYITNGNYVFIWNMCFEFDNFSDLEIANALSSINAVHSFADCEVAACRREFGSRGDTISTLYRLKTNRDLNKPLLAARLIDNLIKHLDDEFTNSRPKRKLLAKIYEIIELASQNYQPSSYDAWKANQESGYLGKKAE
jgi:hypothetical protein